MSQTPQGPEQPPGQQPPSLPPPYPVQAGPPPVAPEPQNGFAIASMVVGIVSLLGLIFAFFIPIVGPLATALIGGLAVVLGIVGRGKAREPGAGQGAGMAIAGIICGTATLIVSVLLVIACGLAINAFQNFSEQVQTMEFDEGGKKRHR